MKLAGTVMSSQLVFLGRIPYLVHPEVIGRVASASEPGPVKPTVVISQADFESGNLSKILADFGKIDDVYCADFGNHITIQPQDLVSTNPGRVDIPGQFLLARNATSSAEVSVLSHGDGPIPQGPYFLKGANVHQAWRLYNDIYDGFITTVVPESATNPSIFKPMQSLSEDGLHKVVAVPSRLYARRSPDKPLSGVRVSIKDNIDLNGIKTTLMSRAQADLYPPKTKSASIVEQLISQGAIVVGKTKLCAFASAEEPTDQWVDYHCPINPRGDQYQSPSGSTTGGAAALAGYDWLDMSLGTDTSGSIRAPATCCGLFALRASVGTANMTGIATRSHVFDTAGILGRDLSLMKQQSAALLNLTQFDQVPKRILYPKDFFPHANEQQQAMVESFVQIISVHLGVNVTTIDIQQMWLANMPKEAGNLGLKDYLKKSAFSSLYYDLFNETQQLRDDYRAAFHKDVFVGPYVKWSWDLAKDVTLAEKQQGESEMTVFRKWFMQHVMDLDPESGSSAVLIMPNGRAGPKYRDDPNGAPGVVGSFSENYLASVLQLPQLIIPIGQNAYQSRISGQLEYRPIACSLVGAKGSDWMLMSLAEAALQQARWPTVVNSGQLMFPLAENNRNTRSIMEKANF